MEPDTVSSQIVLQPKYAAENACGTAWSPHGTRKHTCGDIIPLTSDCYQHAVWGRSVEKICPLTADGFPTSSFGRIAIHAILKPKQQNDKNREVSPKAQSPLYDHNTSTPNLHPCSNRIASWPLDLPNFAPLIPHWRAVAPTWLGNGKENLLETEGEGCFSCGSCCHLLSFFLGAKCWVHWEGL